MFLAMSKDIRVLIIKLADRLHNMQTLEFMRKRRRKIEKSRETLDIYAPLASRLGIYTVKFELEDISLKYLHPQEYHNNAGDRSDGEEGAAGTVHQPGHRGDQRALDQMNAAK